MLKQQNRILSLPCECLLKWDDIETSLIMCKKHYNDYDNMKAAADVNYKTEQFIKRVINPSGSRFCESLLKDLR